MWTIKGRGPLSFSLFVFIIFFFHFKPCEMFSSSSSNSDDFTSSSNDEDILEDMDQDDLVIFQIMQTIDGS
jgi:hypothetical protein